MNAFTRARKEFYGYLYKRFLAKDGPYCGHEEYDSLCEANGLMEKARIFANDMGHLKSHTLKGVRLNGAGILFAEKELEGEKDGD